ncbi:MAG TPA: class I SAM-dependent methyltransferase [Trebonia sp.]|jgi:SAM-dependent methyltransferase|nr:class I SAM-dependent methyltransferase [Trebonia sp.]
MAASPRPQVSPPSAERITYAKAFGPIAEEYDRGRPGYPATLLDDVLALPAGLPEPRVLEVGAGTGQATAGLARDGVPVHCLEPSRRMAGLLRERCAGRPGVQVTVTTFERWRPKHRYTLLVAAQSWHLVDPEVRLVKAAEVLRPGGAIAVWWHQIPQPVDRDRQHELNRILHQEGFELQNFSPPPGADRTAAPSNGGWQQRSPYFEPLPPKRYRTRALLSFGEYADLIATYPEFRAMPAGSRKRALTRIAESVFTAGPVDVTQVTMVNTARRTNDCGS